MAKLETLEGGPLCCLPVMSTSLLQPMFPLSRELLGVSRQQSNLMTTDTCVQPSKNMTTLPSWARSFERGLLR